MSNTHPKIKELEDKLCKEHVPSGFNIYEWGREHPDTAIAHSLKRIERIFDNADEIFFGFSGGKDSTLSAELAILELKRRWQRVENGIKRDGTPGVDPLDKKWVGKKLNGNTMDCEWIWTDVINHIIEFTASHGPGVYEVGGKKFSGNSLHKTASGEVLTMREIFERVQQGEEIEVIKHITV